MKPHGSHFEYEALRNDNLMTVYHEIIVKANYVRMPDIYEMVANSPSRRFWVSEERAAIVVSAMMRGDKLKKMRPLKREMYNEIYNRAMRLREKYPELPVSQLVAKVVEQPAPKFYLTPGSAKVLICKIRKEWYYQRTKRRLRHLF